MTIRIYRRSITSYIWHFCSNCTAWPAGEYQEASRASPLGELCSECQALLIRQACATLTC